VLALGSLIGHLEHQGWRVRHLEDPVAVMAAYVGSQCSYGGGARTTGPVLRLFYRYESGHGISRQVHKAEDFRSVETNQECLTAKNSFDQQAMPIPVSYDRASPWKFQVYENRSLVVPVLAAASFGSLLLMTVYWLHKRGKAHRRRGSRKHRT
jgi:hypothetical protein